MANQISLTSQQLQQLNDLTSGGTTNFVAGYAYINSIIQGNSGVDAQTKYFFNGAQQVNANSSNSDGNNFIRGITAAGLAWDGLLASGSGREPQIQGISDSIARNVFRQIIDDAGIPPIATILANDALVAVQQHGQTLGGWGAAFYYWDTPIFDDGRTVGQAILASPADYEKFLAVNAKALLETGVRGFPWRTLEQIITSFDAQAPSTIKNAIVARAYEYVVEGKGFTGDLHNIDGYVPIVGLDEQPTGWRVGPNGPMVTDQSLIDDLNVRYNIRLQFGDPEHPWQHSSLERSIEQAPGGVTRVTFLDTEDAEPWISKTLVVDGQLVDEINVKYGEDQNITIDLDEDDSQPWSQRTTKYGEDGTPEFTVEENDAGGISALLRNGNNVSLADIPGALGSQIGNLLTNELGGGPFVKLAVGTLAGSVGAHLGNLIKAEMFADAAAYSQTAATMAVQAEIPTFTQTLQYVGISTISSLLIGELLDELGVDGLEGAIVQTIGTSITTKLVTNIYNVSVLGYDPSMLFAGFEGIVPGVFNAVGSILGSTLAAQVVYPTNQVGAIGGQIGSAIGSIVGQTFIPIPFLGAAVGSFLGQIAGTLIGGIFGSEPNAQAWVRYNEVSGTFTSGSAASHGGNATAFAAMASHQAQTINALVAFTGGRVDPNSLAEVGIRPISYMQMGDNFVFQAPGVFYTNYSFNSFDPLVPQIDPALLSVIRAVDLHGGDILMRRAWQNSQATNTSAFSTDLQIAKDYRLYLENSELINAIMAAEPDSAFTTGWALTLLRADELGLNEGSADDFNGGIFAHLNGSVISRLGWAPSYDPNEPDTLVLDNPNGEDYRIDNVFGPGTVHSASGGEGADTISLASLPVHGVTHVAAGAGNDTATGSIGTDLLDGGDGNDTINGANGHDWLYGGGGDDTLVGANGDDLLVGGAGNDIIIIEADERGDTVVAATTGASSQFDIVRFGADINFDDTTFSRKGADLVINTLGGWWEDHGYWGGYQNTQWFPDMVWFETSNGLVVVKEFFLTKSGVDQFEFVGGGVRPGTTVWNTNVSGYVDEIQPLAGGGHRRIQLDGASQHSWTSIVTEYDASGAMVGEVRHYDNGTSLTAIVGTAADNVLDGGAADDLLMGNGGNDTLNGNAGNNLLEGGAGNDTYIVNGAGNTVTEAANAGVDKVVATLTYALPGNVENLTLAGTDAINGTGNSLDNIIIGNAADNSLFGLDGHDTLDGGAGNDTLRGGTGNDTYLFGIGSGQDTIDNSDGGTDRVVFGTGITVSTLTFVQVGNNLQILISGVSDTLTVVNWFLGASYQIASFQLADGSTLSPELSTTGTSGNDSLTGSSFADFMNGLAGNDVLDSVLGNDILVGGTGSDTLRGGGGNDTYAFARGDGADTVYDDYRTSAQVWVESGFWEQEGYWNGKGDWIVTGQHWVDTSHWDTVETRQDGGVDVLSFGAGISGSDLAITLSGNDLIVGVKDPANPGATFAQLTDKITLQSWKDPLNRIETLRFADGTTLGLAGILAKLGTDGVDTITWTETALTANFGAGNDNVTTGAFDDVLTGGDGNDTLNASAGNDILYGNAGNDSLLGGDGIDHLDGGAGADSHNGGAGFDYARYDYFSSAGVTANLSTPGGNTGDAAGDTYTAIEGLVGTAFGDVLTGTNGDNDIWGVAGNDTLDGLNGTDTLHGGDGNDSLLGGAGTDHLYGDAGADSLNGGTEFDYARYDSASVGVTASLAAPVDNTGEAAGDTYISIEGFVGSIFNDILVGDGGNNTFWGNPGDDWLRGGAGVDTLMGGDGNDELEGGTGADTLNGEGGFDYASYRTAAAGVTARLASPATNTGDAAGDGFTSIEGLIGSAFNDVLTGDGGNNVLFGENGNDTLDGGAGGDALYGGAGNDSLVGGDGVDDMDGGAGADSYNGGLGFDFVHYNSAAAGVTANLSAPAGNTGDAVGDTYVAVEGMVGSSFNDVFTGTDSDNELWGLAGDDTLNGLGGTDSLYGGDGNDSLFGGDGIDHMDGGAGADNYNGGLGIDFVHYNSAAAGVTADLSAPAGNTGDAAGDTYVSVEGAVGSAFNDVLIGDGGSNELWGLNGNDWLQGGLGTDLLVGGEGDDELEGGGGADQLNGEAGIDAASYRNSTAAVTASLAAPVNNAGDAVGDTYVAVEGLMGSAFNDTLVGDGGNNGLWGHAGHDWLRGGVGNDTLAGGDGDDVLEGGVGADQLNGEAGADYASYEAAAAGVTASLASPVVNTGEAAGDTYSSIERILGSAFNDMLTGDDGGNELRGNAGNDTLTGGAGDDTLIGGAGNDTYVFGRGDGQDIVVNGTAGNAGPSGVLAFGSNVDKNQLWFKQVGNDLVVSVLGTTDQVTILDWYSSNISQLQDIKTADNWEVDSGLAQLVQAMATYSASNPGFNPTSASQAPSDSTLQGAIAVAWHQ